MNLVSGSWIPVIFHSGESREIGLGQAFSASADIAALACDDPLEEGGILRLLFAIDKAARTAGIPAERWLRENRANFELFGSSPFAQNPAMAQWWEHAKPAVAASYRTAGNGHVFHDHRHNASGVRMTPAEVARLLLLRQTFSVGGRVPYPAKPFGPAATFSKMAVAAPRPLCFYHCPNLADTIAVNRVPGPAGEFLFTWPQQLPPASDVTPQGQIDSFTWLSRSILAQPDSDGLVSTIALCEGMRYGTVTDPDLLPHTTYRSDKATPPQPRPVHIARPAWRQLLTAWADPQPVGILAHDPPTTVSEIRLIGLASMQARIDGPVIGSIPRPVIDRAAVLRLDDAIGKAFRTARTVLRKAANPFHGANSTKEWISRRWPLVQPELTRRVEHLVGCTLAGEMTLDDTSEALNVAAEETVAWLIDDLVPTQKWASTALIAT